ncbi:glycosyltransferase [Natrononativus amylolyticus]|uniref:glycosyltransferase n=1 Tax=Natrononativus amylolyticus TaxID=2963434 RepID=UPI0020CCA8EB|nr:glycosyltransferase [Natrononativus amylolyticus]
MSVTVSVVIPVYNDPDGVVETLTSLRKQTYPVADYEVIVVDNDSTDTTRKAAADVADRSENVTVVDETDVQSSYAARNTGVEHAAGSLIAFVDADMTVPPTWLEDLASLFDDRDVDYVGCNVELYVEGAPTITAEYNVATGFPVEYYLTEQRFAPTCCLAVRRAVIDDVGPFDATLVSSGDLEFGQRVAAAGYTQRFARDITVYHPARKRFGELRSKAIRVGRGHEQLYESRGDSRPIADPRNVLPPHPGRFRKRLSGSHSPDRYLAFYLLSYVYKLHLLAGRILERRSRRHPR